MFNQDLSSWKTPKVVNMYEMFLGANAFRSDLSDWDVSRVVDATRAFEEGAMLDEYKPLLVPARAGACQPWRIRPDVCFTIRS